MHKNLKVNFTEFIRCPCELHLIELIYVSIVDTWSTLDQVELDLAIASQPDVWLRTTQNNIVGTSIKLQHSYLGFYVINNRVYLERILIQRDKGKMRIKNYKGDYQKFRNLFWKFHNFWTSGAIRIKSDKKNRLIKCWDSIKNLSGCNLGIKTCLGANWGSQACTHRIREEREGATWQHLIGPPQHVSATLQHPIDPPHPCGSHTPDRWVPLVSRGSTSLGHVSRQLTDY
jgi:hypothetical protein